MPGIHRPSPVVIIPEPRTKIFLDLFQDNDGDSPFEYELRMNVENEFLHCKSTKSVIAESTLANFQIRASWDCVNEYWECDGGDVRAGSTIDKAVKSGRPVPFVLAIRSIVSKQDVLSWKYPQSLRESSSWPDVFEFDSDTESDSGTESDRS